MAVALMSIELKSRLSGMKLLNWAAIKMDFVPFSLFFLRTAIFGFESNAQKQRHQFSGVNLHLSENVAKTLECNFMTGNLKWTKKRLPGKNIPPLDQKITRLNWKMTTVFFIIKYYSFYLLLALGQEMTMVLPKSYFKNLFCQHKSEMKATAILPWSYWEY